MSLVFGSTDNSQRFGSIDAVRGAAMLFVFLSHFTAGYVWTPRSQEIAGYLRTLSMIASPTFVIVSGMVVGFLASTNLRGFGDLRIKLFDRGIFLLLFGHLLLALTQTPTAAHFTHAYTASFITDVIAVAIIIGPSMVAALPARTRIGLAAVVFLVDWWAIVNWHPIGAALTAKLYLVGLTSSTGVLAAFPVFPVVPWFAVYLAGTVVGEWVGKMYVRGDRREAHYFLARVGGACFLIAAVVHGMATVARQGPSGPVQWDMNLLTFISIYGKFPPGLVYLGFFGGAGIMMLATIFELDRREKLALLLNELRKIGRSSLFMFTVQYAFYRAVLPKLGLPYTPFWPLIFILSVILLAKLAAVWDAGAGNRYLTVGITSLWRRNAQRVPLTVIPTRSPIPAISIHNVVGHVSLNT